MQAAGLVGTYRPAWTGGAQVAFSDQPNLSPYGVTPFQRAIDKFLRQLLQRLLVRKLQQCLRGEIGIEVAFAGWFHEYPSFQKEK